MKFYLFAIKIASVNNKKASLWIKGRKQIFIKIAEWKKSTSSDSKIIWMHCASLGEFEQGRPVLDNLRITNPSYKIVLTFFSPSGYEVRKNFTGVDAVFYLPLDGKSNAKKFVELINPSLVVWVKYEYWYYYLTTLKQKNIPVVLISAYFRETQPFFKRYAGLWKKMLECFDKIFVQDHYSLILLQKNKIGTKAKLAKDTRFDRVVAVSKMPNELPTIIEDFCGLSTIIVAGSTWLQDEQLLAQYAKENTDIKFIIVPHEVTESKLLETENLFKNCIRYSSLASDNTAVQTLIIDNVGMLSSLYKLATIAYIGGGFNASGIHNLLEAAVQGRPILFGKNYQKFNEAIILVEFGVVFSIDNYEALKATLDKLLGNKYLMAECGDLGKKYVLDNQGASKIIVDYIQANLLLTN